MVEFQWDTDKRTMVQMTFKLGQLGKIARNGAEVERSCRCIWSSGQTRRREFIPELNNVSKYMDWENGMVWSGKSQ